MFYFHEFLISVLILQEKMHLKKCYLEKDLFKLLTFLKFFISINY